MDWIIRYRPFLRRAEVSAAFLISPSTIFHQPTLIYPLMLDCKACISRCIRTIFADVLHPIRQLRLQRQLLPVLNKLRLSSTAERAYHSARPTQPRLSRHDGLQNRRRPEARHQTTQAISADNHFYTAPPQSKTSSLTKVESVEFKKKKHLDRELVYLRDPVKLAEKTITLLRNDDAEKALDLVRQASRSTSCTVSWNHLIDYTMSTGSIRKAVGIYNEVFKSSYLCGSRLRPHR